MSGRICGSLMLAAVAGLALSAMGQEAPVRQIRVSPAGNGAHHAQLPYTAEIKTTRVQTLADGSTITHVTNEVMARDSRGRTMSIVSSTSGSEDQVLHSSVNVNDPVARTHTYWFVPGQRVTMTNEPELGSVRSSCGGSNLAPMMQVAAEPRAKPVNEDLGVQTFEGIEAHGHRTTTTFAAGAIGNSDPVVRTYEVWFSTTPGLSGINVRQVNDDPQTGRSTRELVKFTQGEPDAAMFQPPQDYETVTQETHDEVRCP
jgi:hypothetical protein